LAGVSDQLYPVSRIHLISPALTIAGHPAGTAADIGDDHSASK